MKLELVFPSLRDKLGLEHSETQRAGLVLARARMRAGDYAGARTTLQQLERVLERGGSAGSRALLDVRADLAGLLELEGRYDEAEALHASILQAHRAHRGDGHTTTVHARVAQALAAARNDDESPDDVRLALLAAAGDLERSPFVREPRARSEAHRLAHELGRLFGADRALELLAPFTNLMTDRPYLHTHALLGAGRGVEGRTPIDPHWQAELLENSTDASSAVVRRTLAECLLAEGNFPTARNHLRRSWIATPPTWSGARIDHLRLFRAIERASSGLPKESWHSW